MSKKDLHDLALSKIANIGLDLGTLEEREYSKEDILEAIEELKRLALDLED